MKSLELYNKAASDEVLREWLSTMYKESDPHITLEYDARENVAKTPSSFNGSIGALVDGRLIKIEYHGTKGVDEIANVTVEKRHISRGAEPDDVAVLCPERVISGMLSKAFGETAIVEIATIERIIPYESYSGKRIEIRVVGDVAALGDDPITQLSSMSDCAYEAAALEPGKKIMLVKAPADNRPNGQIIGIAEFTAELEHSMLNHWQKDVEV